MEIPITVEESGRCRLYAPRDLAKKISCLRGNRDGSYETYYFNLPELSRHFRLSIDPDGKRLLRKLQKRRKAAIRSKKIEADGVASLFQAQKTPRMFQLRAINLGLLQKHILLADDVGLGKTIISIGVLLKAFEQEEIDSAVILGPSSVKRQWKNEFLDANDYLPDLADQITIVDGDKHARRQAYERRNTITILHYQSLLRDADLIAELVGGRDYAVVADECSGDGAIKNRTSKTSKAFKKVFADAVYKLAVTATPIENGLADLYSIMQWVDDGLFGRYADFQERYCKTIDLKIKRGRKVFRIPKIIGYQNLDDAKARIAHRFIRRTAAQVSAELPDVTSVVYRVDICKEAREYYDVIAEQARAKDKVIGSIVPLRRCCAAPNLVGGKGDDSGKLDELLRLLNGELSGERCIIVTQWRETYIDTIKKRLRHLKPFFIHGKTEQQEREVTRRRFMDKERPILVMTEVGTRGLNLQVASVLINLDIHFNPAKMWQRIGRIYRIGSEHQHVRVISFLAADTIEERVYDTLSKKQDLFKTMFETDGVERLGTVVNKWSDRDLRKMI